MKKEPRIIVLSVVLSVAASIAGYRAYQSYAWEKCGNENWMPHIGDPYRLHVTHDESMGETIYTTLPDDDELLFSFAMIIPPKGCYSCDNHQCDMFASVDKEGKIAYYQFTLQEPTREGN